MLLSDSERASLESQAAELGGAKKKRGRPKGSKNAPKTAKKGEGLTKAEKAKIAKATGAKKSKAKIEDDEDGSLHGRTRKAVADVASDPDDLDAMKAAARIVKRWDAWQKTTGEMHDVGTRAGERIKSAEASFRETVERGVETSNDAAALAKLNDIVVKWQDWQESIAQSAEERKEAKEKRTKAAKALERAIEESRQLSIFPDDD